ncbi:Transposase [Candidatus Electronema halotolerans]
MMDMDSRLRAGRGFGKSETEASAAVFRQLKERGHSDGPPPTVSDGWGGIREAMLEIFGKVPEYSGKGRPPSKKRPQPGWKYLQIIKQRDEKGNFLGTRRKAVHGSMRELDKIFGKSTAYIERSHLTMRTFSSRLTRKGIAFSKNIDMHKVAAALEDMYYNFIKPLKTLRLNADENSGLKWLSRTPAMAADLTDHIWTLKEVFSMVVIEKQHSTG